MNVYSIFAQLLWLLFILCISGRKPEVVHQSIFKDSLDTSGNAFAVVTVCTQLQPNHLYRQLSRVQGQFNISAYYFVDKPDSNFVHKDNNVWIIGLNSTEVRWFGYSGFVAILPAHRHNNIQSWDKALYFFSYSTNTYKFYWMFEFDVLIPTFTSFLNIHHVAILNNADLVIRSNNIYSPTPPANFSAICVLPADKWENWTADCKQLLVRDSGWWWSYIVTTLQIGPPWYTGSLACAIGISPKMLKSIKDYAVMYGHLEFHEFFLNTLAVRSGLKVQCPSSLSTILLVHHWMCSDLQRQPLNWFHPVKKPFFFVGSCLLNGTLSPDVVGI